MQDSSRMKETESKIMPIRHDTPLAEPRGVLLCGFRVELAVTGGVIHPTEKSIQEAIGMLVIREVEYGGVKQTETAGTYHAFTV